MNRIDFRDQISNNKRKSFFLILIVFVVVIIFSLVYIVGGYYNSHKIAIASVGAKPASREKHKMFFDLVEGLTLASGLPMPKLYVMPSQQINAFASGRNPKKAVICVTEGALNKLDRRELEGVLAHELGHVGNYDIRYMTLTAILVGMIAIISQIFLRSLFFSGDRGGDKKNAIFIIIGIALAILAPIVVWLVQMSISRKREYGADATAVKFTRHPDGLIKALEKIKNEHAPAEKNISKAVAPLFFANPFKNLGSTHPPIEKRIEVLKRM